MSHDSILLVATSLDSDVRKLAKAGWKTEVIQVKRQTEKRNEFSIKERETQETTPLPPSSLPPVHRQDVMAAFMYLASIPSLYPVG